MTLTLSRYCYDVLQRKELASFNTARFPVIHVNQPTYNSLLIYTLHYQGFGHDEFVTLCNKQYFKDIFVVFQS